MNMRKMLIIAFSIFTVLSINPVASAAENVITPYTLNNDYFSMSISLENLSRPTFQVLDGMKSPIFVPGDKVSYTVSLVPNRDFIWSKANALITKQYGTKYKLNDVKMHFSGSLKYGDEEAIDLSETYQYQTNKFLDNRLNGVMVVPAKKNLILTWAGIDIQGLAQGQNIVSKNGSTQQLGASLTIELDVIDLVENQVVFMDTSKTPQAFAGLTSTSLSLSHQFVQLKTNVSSNLPITGVSSTPGTCAYMSGVIAFKKAGSCLVILTQPGNEIYASAKPLVLSFKITPANKNVKLCNRSCPVS
jgi:hypothetical protein